VPVMNVSGTSDHLLAPAASVARLADLVPTAASVRLESAPGGHLGVLVGLKAQETTWKYLAEFLAETGPDPDQPE
jgi:polyhydroxyalkanoate synthase